MTMKYVSQRIQLRSITRWPLQRRAVARRPIVEDPDSCCEQQQQQLFSNIRVIILSLLLSLPPFFSRRFIIITRATRAHSRRRLNLFSPSPAFVMQRHRHSTNNESLLPALRRANTLAKTSETSNRRRRRRCRAADVMKKINKKARLFRGISESPELRRVTRMGRATER